MKPPEILKKSHAHVEGRKESKEQQEIEEEISELIVSFEFELDNEELDEVSFEASPALVADLKWGKR